MIIQLDENYEYLVDGTSFKKKYSNGSVVFDISEIDFEMWLHTKSITKSRQIENWASQDVLLIGSSIVGKYYTNEYEYLSNKF